jgi:hypothetical protein
VKVTGRDPDMRKEGTALSVKIIKALEVYGGRTRTRTLDPLIKRQKIPQTN